jgi:hypothetical protein
MVGRAVIAGLVGAVALAGCGEGDMNGEGLTRVGSERPDRPPKVDPRAGAAAYVAAVGDRAVLLDRRGRVRRVLPRHTSYPFHCGESRLIQADEWGGRVVVRTLGGRRLWRQRIPARMVSAGACLDARGAAVAVVTDPHRGRRKVLHRVTSRGQRPVLPFLGEVPLMTAKVMYVSDGEELRLHDPVTGRLLRKLAVPAHAHGVLPSPDGMRLALVSLDEEDGMWDRSHVLDLRTGEVRSIDLPRATALGWLADGRLAVGSGLRTLHFLDGALQITSTVKGFPTNGTMVAGERVLTVRGRRLLSADARHPEPRVLGRLPRETYLGFAL